CSINTDDFIAVFETSLGGRCSRLHLINNRFFHRNTLNQTEDKEDDNRQNKIHHRASKQLHSSFSCAFGSKLTVVWCDLRFFFIHDKNSLPINVKGQFHIFFANVVAVNTQRMVEIGISHFDDAGIWVFRFIVHNNLFYLPAFMKFKSNVMTRFYFHDFRIISCNVNIAANWKQADSITSLILCERIYLRCNSDRIFAYMHTRSFSESYMTWRL